MKFLRRNGDLTFADSDVLEEENDGCYRELRAQSLDQFWIYIGLSDMLESRGYCQQNSDGVFSVIQSMTAVQPGSNCKNDENKGISQNANEKKYACWPKPINSDNEGGGAKKKTYLDGDTFFLGDRKLCEWHRERTDQPNPMPRQA